jgi:hypothetical protein
MPSKEWSQEGILVTTLLATYLAITVLSINTYLARMSADQEGLLGNQKGWLGDRWLPVLAALVLLAIVLQVTLSRKTASRN